MKFAANEKLPPVDAAMGAKTVPSGEVTNKTRSSSSPQQSQPVSEELHVDQAGCKHQNVLSYAGVPRR